MVTKHTVRETWGLPVTDSPEDQERKRRVHLRMADIGIFNRSEYLRFLLDEDWKREGGGR